MSSGWESVGISPCSLSCWAAVLWLPWTEMNFMPLALQVITFTSKVLPERVRLQIFHHLAMRVRSHNLFLKHPVFLYFVGDKTLKDWHKVNVVH